jgi:hypothetical protein
MGTLRRSLAVAGVATLTALGVGGSSARAQALGLNYVSPGLSFGVVGGPGVGYFPTVAPAPVVVAPAPVVVARPPIVVARPPIVVASPYYGPRPYYGPGYHHGGYRPYPHLYRRW